MPTGLESINIVCACRFVHGFCCLGVPDYKTRVLYSGRGLTFETLTIEALGGSYIRGGGGCFFLGFYILF